MIEKLYQKRHGLPGVPFAAGSSGTDGTGGNNVYFGYINEFFDVIDVSVDNIVRAASMESGQHYTGVYGSDGTTVAEDVATKGSRYREITDDPEFPGRFSESYEDGETVSREYTKADVAAIGKDASGNLSPWNVSLGTDRWKISDPSGLLDTHGYRWPGQPWDNSSVGPYIPFNGILDTSLRMMPGRYSLSIADKNGFDLFSATSGQNVYQFALTPKTRFYESKYSGFDDNASHTIDNPSIGELEDEYISGGGYRLKTDFIKYAASVNENMQIPDKLKEDIKAGDIIYFYTDSDEFDITGKVEYMTVITEGLEKCTYQDLIDNAVLVEPFSFKFFDENASNQDGYLYSTLPAVTGFYNSTTPDDAKDVSAYGRNMVNLLGCLGEDVTLQVGTLSKEDSTTENNVALFIQNRGDDINSTLSFSQKNGEDDRIIIDTSSNKSSKKPMLKINRAYVRKNNIGNLETNSIVNPDGYKVGSDGYVHMLDASDYDPREKTFRINPSKYIEDLTSGWRIGVICETYMQSLTASIGEYIPVSTNKMKHADNRAKVKTFQWDANSKDELAFRLTMDYEYDTMHVVTVWAELPGCLRKTSHPLKAAYSAASGGFILSDMFYSEESSSSSSDDKDSREPKFVIPSISAEKITEAPVDIIIPYERNQDVKVFINTSRITPLLDYSSTDAAGQGSWCYVSMEEIDPETDIKDGYLTLHLKVSMTSNLPTIGGSYDSAAEYNASPGSSAATEANGCDIFNTLLEGQSISTEERSLTVSVNYTYDNAKYSGFSKIVQPGYEDMRRIPNISVEMHKDIRSLEDANRSDLGVTSNEFQFFVDVAIDEFDQNIWGSYVPEENIALNIELKNMTVDYDFISKYGIQKIQPTRTFYVNTPSDADFKNNYVRFSTYVMDASAGVYQGKTQSELDKYHFNAVRISATDNGSQITPERDVVRTRISRDQFAPDYDDRLLGIQDDIVVTIKNVHFSDIKGGKFRFRVVTEMGNPLFSQLFYQFYVSNLWIEYKYNDKTGTEKTSKFYVGTNNLAVQKQIGSRETYDYMFSSEALKAFVCPVSMTTIPNENDVSAVNYIAENYSLDGSTGQISLKTELYVDSNIVAENESLSDAEKTSRFVKQ